jgi:hypothetical protein
MFSLAITPEARAAILEQFTLCGLREPALFISGQSPVADVADDARAYTGYVVQFVELPADVVVSPHLVMADGIRVILGPRGAWPYEGMARLSFQDGKLYAEDVAGTNRPTDLQRLGIPLGLVPMAEVLSSSRAHRFRLLYIASGLGLDFHSLQYEVNHDGEWQPAETLTQKQFQSEHKFRRWVSKLHSVQDDSGIALIQVGESSCQIGQLAPSVVSYSWRAWDLHRNVELRRLKECKYPAEPLE